ncbi:hypothetical protein F5890DRAFT_1554688 [Lentinula detonsa]|uniref:Uncharacterized protein n=1 Tax=Lentinula detonsa TaxID=2804962 RepID=A0AA38PYQ7_9AGAR|nr:hypothetical protein F5890DRAFT_1554688 [Lentinula detonsa]
MFMILSWALAAHVTQLVFAQSSDNPASTFNFDPITGLLTPSDVTTATVIGHPPPSNVVFSEDGVLITAGPIATNYIRIPQDPEHSIFTPTVPSLYSATDSIVVFIESISSNTDLFGIGPVSIVTASIDIILGSGSATLLTYPSAPAVSYTPTSSVNSTTSHSSPESTSTMSSNNLFVLTVIYDLINTRSVPVSSTPDGISSPPTSSSMTSSPIVTSSTPTNLSAGGNPEKSKLPAILGGTVGATVSIQIAILLWVSYRRCPHWHRRHVRRQIQNLTSETVQVQVSRAREDSSIDDQSRAGLRDHDSREQPSAEEYSGGVDERHSSLSYRKQHPSEALTTICICGSCLSSSHTHTLSVTTLKAEMFMLLSWALAAHVTQLVNAQSSDNPTPTFNFQPITGPLTPSDVMTATVDGHPPPFNVVFSEDGVLITAGPIATNYMPIPQDPKHSIFTLTVPSLQSATDSIIVFIEYLSGDTDPFPVGTASVGIASIGTILGSGSATTPAVSSTSTSSSNSVTSSSSPTSTTSSNVSNASASVDGISSPPTSSSMTSSPIAASSTPTTLSAGGNPKKSKLPEILGGTVGATVSILIAILLWVWYRRCRHLRHRHAQRQELSASSPPTAFHADMMMKPQGNKAMFPVFEPLGIVGQPKRTSRRSMSSGSSRSIDSTHEKSPALGAFSRSAMRPGSLEEYHDEEDIDDDGHDDGSSLVTMKNDRGPSRLSPPRTDRQMELEQKIYDLRAQMITMSHQEEGGVDVESHGSESAMHWHHIRGKIKRLEALEFSDWALGMTNQVPEDFLS